jgi:hypothetical protein
MFPTEVTLTSWKAVNSFDQRGRIYRGHRQADWPLKSSLERRCDEDGVAGLDRRPFEERLFREFRRGYHQYSPTPPPREWGLEWSAVMQHHGAPTRFLDFTYSIYVALYFALQEAPSDAAAVWSIDRIWAHRESTALLRGHGKPKVDDLQNFWTESDETLASDLIFGTPQIRMAWPVNPFHLNERLRIQKGIFLVPGDVGASLMENLAALPGHDTGGHIVKIMIPKELRREVLRQLFHMNVSHTSLFPGLDGYARSLGVYHPTVDEPQDRNG